MNSSLSIIIVTYNSNDVLADCLNSIDRFNDIEETLEVIIVDNSPVNKTSSLIDELRLSLNIKYVHNPENGGFGQGNNIGAREATGEYLLFLNPDTILIDSIFSYAIAVFKEQNVYSLGFTLCDKQGVANNSFGLLPENNLLYAFLPIKLIYLMVIKFRLFKSSIFPWGAAFMTKRCYFISAGMFDENIFLCNEEPDLVHRLPGKSCVIISKKIVHLEGHTTEVESFRFQCWLDSTKYYFNKYNLDYAVFLKNEILANKLKILIKKMIRQDWVHLQDYIEKISLELKKL